MAVERDPFGNVYVVGHGPSPDIGGSEDIYIVKFDEDLVLQWAATYNGPASGNDRGVDVDTLGGNSPTGYAVVSGRSEGIGTRYDYVTLLLDGNGNFSADWPDNGFGAGVRRYATSGNDFPVALDAEPVPESPATGISVAITGYSPNRASSSSQSDILTIMYDHDGDLAWTAVYNGPNGRDEPAAIVFIADQGVFVTGQSQQAGETPPYHDFVTLKYVDSTGDPDPFWNDLGDGVGVRRFKGVLNLDDQAVSLALQGVQGAYGVFVTGRTQQIVGGGYDYATIFYDWFDGTVYGPAYYGSQSNGDDVPVHVAPEHANGYARVGIAGHSPFTGTGADKDYLSRVHWFTGTEITGFDSLVFTYGRSGASRDIPVRADWFWVELGTTLGYLAVTGNTDGPGTGTDWTTGVWEIPPP
jgi:hypothetical protein